MKTQQIAKRFPNTRFDYDTHHRELSIDLYNDGCITLKIFEEDAKKKTGVLDNYYNYVPKSICAHSSETTAAQNFDRIDEIARYVQTQRITVLDAHRYVVRGVELTSNLVDLLCGEMPFYIRKWPGCGYFYKNRKYQFALNTVLPQLINAACELIRINDKSLGDWARSLKTEFLQCKTKKHARVLEHRMQELESSLDLSTLILKEKQVLEFLETIGSVRVDEGNKNEILSICLKILLTKCTVAKFYEN